MKLPIPKEALAQHVITFGKTRSGKSSKLRCIVEQKMRANIPTCIIDPKGDWWGLKSSKDGKDAGYPLVVFGTQYSWHHDIEIRSWEAGATIGELAASGERLLLIDMKGMRVGERNRFFSAFAESYFKHAKGERCLVIDEVHNFAAKGKIMSPDSGEALHWANRLASEGAGLGITILAASQRPQKVHNDFASSCETLIACRVVMKHDRDAIADWIDACGDPAKAKDVMGSLASMKRTDAWVYSPESDFGPKQITFPMFETYDSFAPQGVFASSGKLKGWAAVDLAAIEDKIAAVVAEHKANDPKELRAENDRLRSELAKKDRNETNVSRENEVTHSREVEAAHRAGFDAAQTVYAPILEGVQAIHVQLAQVAALLDEARQRLAALPQHAKNWLPPSGPATAVINDRSGPQSAARPKPAAPAVTLRAGKGDGTLSKAERAILTVLAQLGPSSRTKIAIRAGYASTGGGFRNALSKLRTADRINGSDDRIMITADGAAALGTWTPLPRGYDLLQYWLKELGKAEALALSYLAQRYPGTATIEEAAAHCGYEPNGGGFRNAISRLRTLELVQGDRSMLKASEDLCNG